MIPRIKICEVCGGFLKKTASDPTKFHACTECTNFIGRIEKRANRMFGGCLNG